MIIDYNDYAIVFWSCIMKNIVSLFLALSIVGVGASAFAADATTAAPAAAPAAAPKKAAGKKRSWSSQTCCQTGCQAGHAAGGAAPTDAK